MNPSDIGYVIFEDIATNCRVYHSFHQTISKARKSLRKYNNKAHIGFMHKDEYDRLMED